MRDGFAFAFLLPRGPFGFRPYLVWRPAEAIRSVRTQWLRSIPHLQPSRVYDQVAHLFGLTDLLNQSFECRKMRWGFLSKRRFYEFEQITWTPDLCCNQETVP